MLIKKEICSKNEQNSEELSDRTDLIEKADLPKDSTTSVGSVISITSESESGSNSGQVLDEEEGMILEGSETSSLYTCSVTDESSSSGEEDLDSRGECDEEVFGVVMSMKAKWDALKNIPSSSSQPPPWEETSSVHMEINDDKEEHGSNGEGPSVEEEYPNNQPSASNPEPQLDHQEVVEDGRHRFADYFPTDFTNEMIDFMIDPDNRGGQPWVVPAEKPTKEFLEAHQRKVDEAIRIVLAVTPSVSDDEEDMDSLSSISSDEGIGEMD